MRLEIFDLLDETCEILRKQHIDYTEAEARIIQCLRSILVEKEDTIVEIVSRIKSPNSLREKVIRNKLYHALKTGQEIIDNLHDLVGVTIKCQFIKEEKMLFDLISKKFNQKNNEGFYFIDKFPNICLDLSMTQPQPQKNGYSVYRIDGYCRIGEKKINFELQIKAMVYTFWSEIEHKIVYKNNHYSLNNAFMSDMLSSIRSSLSSIDSQLNIIYNQMQYQSFKDRTLDDKAIKNVIAKSLNDLFIDKIKESIGFTINFKKACDLLSEFLYNRSLVDNPDSNTIAFMKLRKMIENVKSRTIDFESPIKFNDDIVSEDRFTSIMSKAFLFYMNSDFEWYVFFKMLFELLPEGNCKDFEYFIILYKHHFIKDEIFDNVQNTYNEYESNCIIDDILASVALTLVDVSDISILHEDKCSQVANEIEEFTRIFIIDSKSFNEWENSKTFLLQDLTHNIRKIFE
ncbi:MAG: hypothetical protein IKM20_09620 [Erysipelotrichales bacterium]|nr:hypothetical protein [Erysipelotrichales bacterium]